MIEAKRRRIQSVQAYLVAHKAAIGYTQHRPMGTAHIDTMAKLEQHVAKGFSMDCSESGVLIMHVSGCKSPTGSWAEGNTETYLERLHHYYDPKQALPGAFIVFNSNRPLWEQHLAQVHWRDPLHGNPIVFTHGNADDPSFMPLSWLQAGFSGRTTFLSINSL